MKQRSVLHYGPMMLGKDFTFVLTLICGARLWNSLPPDIVAIDTLSWFHREHKTFLFRQSYPSILF